MCIRDRGTVLLTTQAAGRALAHADCVDVVAKVGAVSGVELGSCAGQVAPEAVD
jgi:hypothetical protein